MAQVHSWVPKVSRFHQVKISSKKRLITSGVALCVSGGLLASQPASCPDCSQSPYCRLDHGFIEIGAYQRPRIFRLVTQSRRGLAHHRLCAVGCAYPALLAAQPDWTTVHATLSAFLYDLDTDARTDAARHTAACVGHCGPGCAASTGRISHPH